MGKSICRLAFGAWPGKRLGHVAALRLLICVMTFSSVPPAVAAGSPEPVDDVTARTAAIAGTTATASAQTSAPQRAADVARIVKGIVNFTQWPNKINAIRLCVAQPAMYAEILTQTPLGLGSRTIQPRNYALDDPQLLVNCDAIYLEISDANAAASLLRRVTGKPVLTITGSEEGCDMGSLFCLTSTPGPLSFAANLDGIARSTLLINPKVLLLARPAGSAK